MHVTLVRNVCRDSVTENVTSSTKNNHNDLMDGWMSGREIAAKLAFKLNQLLYS